MRNYNVVYDEQLHKTAQDMKYYNPTPHHSDKRRIKSMTWILGSSLAGSGFVSSTPSGVLSQCHLWCSVQSPGYAARPHECWGHDWQYLDKCDQLQVVPSCSSSFMMFFLVSWMCCQLDHINSGIVAGRIWTSVISSKWYLSLSQWGTADWN